MSRAPAEVEGHIPEGVELPPARKGERALARRRRTAAYLQLAPGGLYMVIGFIVPLIIIVYTSLSTSGLFSTGGKSVF